MTDTGVLTLEVGPATLTVNPNAGGRLGRLRVFDRDLLVTATDVGGSDETGADAHPMLWGSFPMAPWVGRIRRGRFRHAGREHTLPINLEPHAIHGTTYERPWSVVDVHHDDQVAEVIMEIDLDWEFGGSARQEIRLGPGGLRCRLAVTAGTVPMPAEVGWHPWFVKPDHLWFEPRAMYVRDGEGIAIDEPVQLDELEPATGPFDDCFITDRPATLVFGDVAVTISSDADHWVVYDEPTHATCVEPQSGPPDAFNLRPRVLDPGETLERTMLWAWTAPG